MADQSSSKGATRREFIATGAAAASAWMIVPRHVLGQGFTPPSDLVNIAIVGLNGMGAVNAQAVMSQNIVAICDVDDALVEGRIAGWRRALQPPAAQPTTPRPPGPATAPTLPWQMPGPLRSGPAFHTVVPARTSMSSMSGDRLAG